MTWGVNVRAVLDDLSPGEWEELATMAAGTGGGGVSATMITDLVFVVVPVAATAVAIWSKGTLSADQITAAWTLALGYAAGRPVKS